MALNEDELHLTGHTKKANPNHPRKFGICPHLSSLDHESKLQRRLAGKENVHFNPPKSRLRGHIDTGG